ncbi:hypothetical protein [Burkholderia sp. Ac-20365]|uniref:hypothetical protein n=1 Tax=Burkholderia sp. Ac-20365 TaxID=2703897 RepID=UPI00197C64B4|nr:hypothetical protein [Burkholderia sp. Ac-20365]MBN3761119.1 hypothetical protein [Burkholderia sp. Ac-20365]
MFNISFLSHLRFSKQDRPDGIEDAVCRLALRYLVLNSPRLISVGQGGDQETVVHLLQGPLTGDGVGVPPDKPPFLWLYPVDVAVTGISAELFTLPGVHLVPDLSSWDHTPPALRDRVQAGILDALLPKVISGVCVPLLHTLSTMADADAPPIFTPHEKEA